MNSFAGLHGLACINNYGYTIQTCVSCFEGVVIGFVMQMVGKALPGITVKTHLPLLRTLIIMGQWEPIRGFVRGYLDQSPRRNRRDHSLNRKERHPLTRETARLVLQSQ